MNVVTKSMKELWKEESKNDRSWRGRGKGRGKGRGRYDERRDKKEIICSTVTRKIGQFFSGFQRKIE